MDRITFDFETGEVIIDCEGQQSVQLDPELHEKKDAILAAAGFEKIPMGEIRAEINQLFTDIGLSDCKCDEPTDTNNRKG